MYKWDPLQTVFIEIFNIYIYKYIHIYIYSYIHAFLRRETRPKILWNTGSKLQDAKDKTAADGGVVLVVPVAVKKNRYLCRLYAYIFVLSVFLSIYISAFIYIHKLSESMYLYLHRYVSIFFPVCINDCSFIFYNYWHFFVLSPFWLVCMETSDANF
jgi:hypothetical protein